MKIQTTTNLYYSVRSNIFGADAWNQNCSARFKKLLTDYNATINTSARRPGLNYACDHLGISPGIDVIDFHDEKLYTMFIMRWS